MQHLQESIQKVEKEILQEKKKEEVKGLLSEMKKIGIEKLPYSYSALKRFIDPETMNVHYNKHYKGYVNKLNKLIQKRKGDDDLEKIIRNISRFPKSVRNNAGGAFNHALFWNMLSPEEIEIGPEMKSRIIKDFTSIDKFKKEFSKIATERFGSGWVWVVLTKKGTLKIMSTPNQDNPLMNVIEDGGFPLLGLDVWEHAYYLKYKNRRDEYIKNFWTVVNWKFVEDMYKMKTESNLIQEQSLKHLINESKSSFCTSGEKEFYRMLIQNKAIKNIYSNGIRKILKDTFESNWKPATKDEMSGIYELEIFPSDEKGRSIINKLDTNFSVLCFFVKDMNRVLKSQDIEELNFFTTPANQEKEIKRMLNYIEKYSNRIFDPKSAIFKNIFDVLTKKHQIGEDREDYAKKIISVNLPESVVNKVGRLGSKEDAFKKIDLEITIGGNTKKAQVKGFMELIPSEGKVVVTGAGDTVKYPNIDWMVFVNLQRKKVVIFENTGNVVMGNYVFDENAMIYNLG